MPTDCQPAYELSCSCNEYPWGRKGTDSLSARLCAKQPGYADLGPKGKFSIDNEKSYAEMWMGTYPVLPSYVSSSKEDLQDVLDRYPKQLIGEKALQKFGHSKLPYLPKVLSISKALPLQIHPNIEVAKQLHEEDPDNFTDPNHKPEIALALSKFEVFCGFKPLQNIYTLLQLDPLRRFLSSSSDGFGNEELRATVRSMLELPPEEVKEVVQAISKIEPQKFGAESHIPDLAPRLADQYDESDNGILVALVTMNYLVLEAGDCIYVPADGIHAYLSGNIIECMARSNNVLNTGFCPRAERDNVELFCKCLTFAPHSVEDVMLRPTQYEKSQTSKTRLYAPPLSEFDILETRLAAGENETLSGADGPAVLIATEGSASLRVRGPQGSETIALSEGKVVFVAPQAEIAVNSQEGLLMHTALVR